MAQDSRGILNFVLRESDKLPVSWSLLENASVPNAVVVEENLCNNIGVPTAQDYITALNTGGYLLLALAVSATIIIFILYADTVRHIVKFTPPLTKSPAVFVLTVYPIVAVATLCSTVVPRSQLLAEAISQVAFTTAWYQFYCLLLAYCGGESALLSTRPDLLTPRVPPLCCFWCCMPSKVVINKTNLKRIRGAVIQLPVIQCSLYVAMLVAWAESQDLAAAGLTVYLLPIMAASIFTGLWGVIMMVRMLAPRVLADYAIVKKMVVLQLVLILSKVQGLAIKGAYLGDAFPCSPPISPEIFGNLIFNALIITEVVVLQLFAWRLYKNPLPKSFPGLKEVTTDSADKAMDSISDLVTDRTSERSNQYL